MTVSGFLLFILVGAICGGIAEFLLGWSPGGFIASAAVGSAGAVIGDWAAPRLHLPSPLTVRIEGHDVEILWSVLGAMALLIALSLVRRNRSYGRPSS
jgi:uncharacterized membrane protein YeaQ/YmgE (transglycosylase-associated protein family)